MAEQSIEAQHGGIARIKGNQAIGVIRIRTHTAAHALLPRLTWPGQDHALLRLHPKADLRMGNRHTSERFNRMTGLCGCRLKELTPCWGCRIKIDDFNPRTLCA